MKYPSTCRKIVAALSALLLAASPLFAGEGALTRDIIGEIRSSFEMGAHTRVIYNAVTNNDINDLALNRDILRQHSEIFSHKIKVKGVTNQKSSGRCWLFAGLNLMRPAVIERYKLKSFEFSQNYLAFWDKMEKANCFLEHIIEFRDRDPFDREMEILLRSPFSDGGYWRYVVGLIEKYGVVPKEIMPETNSSEKTRLMNRVISRKLRAEAARLRGLYGEGRSMEELRAEKEKTLAEVYRMLVMNLGEPPIEFQWRFENRDSVVSPVDTYTPQSFYREFVGVDLNQYVNLSNDPTNEYGSHCRIRISRNMYDGDDVYYANVHIDVMKDIAMRSVLDDQPVVFSCDVGKDQSRKHGIMAEDLYDYGSIFNTDLSMTKEERMFYRESTPTHAMVFVGVDIKDDRPVKWLVENSWGTEKGSDGYWTLYDTWFDNHVFRVIVKKSYVPEEVLAIYEQDPVIVPPWSPMFSVFR